MEQDIKQIGKFTFGGLRWKIEKNDYKVQASNTYYISDRPQLTLIIGNKVKGMEMPKDRIIENCLRGITSLMLSMTNEDDYLKDAFIIPFAAFLFQFVRTDNFDGQKGTFMFGAVEWTVETDSIYSYHRQINGECDSNIAKIVLDGRDEETGGPKHPAHNKMIYVHEVLHAILNNIGFVDHTEKFVKSYGLFLYEVLTSLQFDIGGVYFDLWRPKKKV